MSDVRAAVEFWQRCVVKSNSARAVSNASGRQPSLWSRTKSFEANALRTTHRPSHPPLAHALQKDVGQEFIVGRQQFSWKLVFA